MKQENHNLHFQNSQTNTIFRSKHITHLHIKCSIQCGKILEQKAYKDFTKNWHKLLSFFLTCQNIMRDQFQASKIITREFTIFGGFLTRFSTKIERNTLNQSNKKNNSPVFIDQSWHAICQNWSKNARKLIANFLEFFMKPWSNAEV
jgi:hypothetical protein